MTEQKNIQQLLSQTWENWEIIEQIGHGVCNDVYKIHRTDTDFFSALKVIPLSDDNYEIRKQQISDIIREINIMKQLHSASNIVCIEDFRILEEDCIALIRMELLTPLESVQMTEKNVIQLGIDICSALTVCESCHILHCDIKPGNILSDGHGGFKLADFGNSRNADVLPSDDGFGTKNYFPPERENASVYTNHSDLYALGLVMYRLLNNNRLPFMPQGKQILSQEDYITAYSKRLSGKPLPPPCNASDAVAAVILKACSFQANDRYRDAREMKNALIAAQMPMQNIRQSPSPFFFSLAGMFLGILLCFCGFAVVKSFLSDPEPAAPISDNAADFPTDNTPENKLSVDMQTVSAELPIVFTSDYDTEVFSCGKHTYCAVDGTVLYILGNGKVDKKIYSLLPKETRKRIEKLVCAEGIISLPSECFYGLTELSEVSLPDSLEKMGNKCFESCGNLKEITLPPNLRELYNPFAFSGIEAIDCSQTSYYRMEDGALYSSDGKTAVYCTGYASDTAFCFPDTVEVIADDFLHNNRTVRNIILPKSLKSIGINVFQDCKYLDFIVIPENVTNIEGGLSIKHVYFEGDFPELDSLWFKNSSTYYFRPEKDGWDIALKESEKGRVSVVVWDEAAEEIRTGGMTE